MNNCKLNSDLINIVRSYLLPLRDNTYFKNVCKTELSIEIYQIYCRLNMNYHFHNSRYIENLDNTKIKSFKNYDGYSWTIGKPDNFI